ncbi:MAG: TlpA disulfide reductase family protein [Myxococcota bacterium]
MAVASTRSYVIAGLGGLAVALALTTAWTIANRPGPAAASRVAVPNFELPRLTGGTVRLMDLRGKVVVIDFWATWCPPCRAEMPWLVRMAQRLESQGVAFVAISEDDPPGQIPLVTEFSRQVPGLERFAVLGDPEIEARYGVTSLPTLFIVDRQGRLVTRVTGAADEAQVVEFVHRIALE